MPRVRGGRGGRGGGKEKRPGKLKAYGFPAADKQAPVGSNIPKQRTDAVPSELVFDPRPEMRNGLSFAVRKILGKNGPPERASGAGAETGPSPSSLDRGELPPKPGGDQSGGSVTQTLTKTVKTPKNKPYREDEPAPNSTRDPNHSFYRPDTAPDQGQASDPSGGVEDKTRTDSFPAAADSPAIEHEAADPPAINPEAADFAAAVVEAYFAILSRFVEAWNVRLMMECIASAGGGLRRGGPGAEGRGIAVPDTVRYIECDPISEGGTPGTPGTPGTRAVRIGLDSGQVLALSYGPEAGRWTLASVTDAGGHAIVGETGGAASPGGGMAGGGRLPGIAGFFRKAVVYTGLLVETFTHTAAHMARKRAEQTILDKLPPDFRDGDAFAEPREQCIGIVEADLIALTKQTGVFEWDGVSVPYRMNDFLEIDVERRYAAFLDFDVTSFMSPSTGVDARSIFPLYSTIIDSAFRVSVYLYTDHHPNIFLSSEFPIAWTSQLSTGMERQTFRITGNGEGGRIQIQVYDLKNNNNGGTVRMLKHVFGIILNETESSVGSFVKAANLLYRYVTEGRSLGNAVPERRLMDEFSRLKRTVASEFAEDQTNRLPLNMTIPANELAWFIRIYGDCLKWTSDGGTRPYPFEALRAVLMSQNLFEVKYTDYAVLKDNAKFVLADNSFLYADSVFMFIMLTTPELLRDALETVTNRGSPKTKIALEDIRPIIETCLSLEELPNVDGTAPNAEKFIEYWEHIRRGITAVTRDGNRYYTEYNKNVVIWCRERLKQISDNSLKCIRAGNVAMMLLIDDTSTGVICPSIHDELVGICSAVNEKVKSDLLEQNTNYKIVLNEALTHTLFAGIRVKHFLIHKWSYHTDSRGFVITGEYLPTGWISSREGPFTELVKTLAQASGYVYDGNDEVANMATEMYEYHKLVYGKYHDIPEEKSNNKDATTMKNMMVDALTSGDGENCCIIGMDRCIQYYEILAGDKRESGENDANEIRNEHLYFTIAEIRENKDDKNVPISHNPYCYCAAHILQQIHAAPTKYPASLYGVLNTKRVVTTGAIDPATKTDIKEIIDVVVPGYVTSKGTAEYVRDAVKPPIISEAWGEAANLPPGTPPTSQRVTPDINSIFSDGSATEGEQLQRAPYNHLDLPGSVNDGVDGHGPRNGARGGAGGYGGSSGSSGLSALTVAFLGAVTVAAAFCRRP
jgi:hypothetical protein